MTRHLTDVEYADEVAEKICQVVYGLKMEYVGREVEKKVRSDEV